MKAKEYLRKIESIDKYLATRKMQIRELESERTFLKSMDYSTDKVQTSLDGAGFTSASEELVDMELSYKQKLKEMIREKGMIIDQIEGVGKQEYVDILRLRYIEYDKYKNFVAIAYEMHMSYDRAKHLHGEALQVFQKKYLS